MKIHLRQIPAGGILHLEGEEDATPLGLEEAGAQAVGPLRYSLDVGRSDGGVFATGRLAVLVQFRCVVTLKDFTQDIVVEAFVLQKSLDGHELVDLTPEIREDIHLALPAHPRSQAAESASARFVSEGRLTGSADGDGQNPWKALDQLKTD